MIYVDAHCHIDLYPDYSQLLAEIRQRQVETIAVTNAPSVYPRFLEICTGNSFVHPAVGLHPELASARRRELPMLLDLLDSTNFVGEVGLDYSIGDEADRQVQREVFGRVLARCADLGNKVLTVHSRRAAPDVVSMIQTQFPCKVILHWFSGSMGTLERALSEGCYFSVNTAMTRSTTGRKIINKIPRDRLLTETDGPFVMVRGRPARAGDVEAVVSFIAGLWQCADGEVALQIAKNFKEITKSSILRM